MGLRRRSPPNTLSIKNLVGREVLGVDGPILGLPRCDQVEDGLTSAPSFHLGEERTFDRQPLGAVDGRQLVKCGFHFVIEIDGRLGSHMSMVTEPYKYG